LGAFLSVGSCAMSPECTLARLGERQLLLWPAALPAC